MEAAVVVAIIMGGLGLTGTSIAALLSRRSSVESNVTAREENVTARLELALDALSQQIGRAEERIGRQGRRIHALEEEVAACHNERDADRRNYQAELAELRERIGGS